MECKDSPHTHMPWNKGKLVGQNAPLKPKEVWAIRARLQIENRAREMPCTRATVDAAAAA